MLINFLKLKNKYKMDVRGVVHIGAHHGEEIPTYNEYSHGKIICFEPLKSNLEVLKYYESDKVKVFPYALGDKEYVAVMNISSNELASSSLLQPAKHLEIYPNIKFELKEVVQVKKLNSFKDEISGCNYMSIDVQGYEYEVFCGASDVLSDFDYIYTEVNRDETYSGNKMIEDIDAKLLSHGFIRVETKWDGIIWGDAFYIKKDILKNDIL